MKLQTRWLDRRIAAPGPYLTLCLHEHEFREVLRKLRAPDPGPWIATPHSQATVHYLQNDRKQTTCVVCMNDWQGRPAVEVAGLLVHEAVHIWQQYCCDIGERNPGDEQEAYAVQSIAQELLAEFARRMEAVGR
jgi:hypothetical protein